MNAIWIILGIIVAIGGTLKFFQEYKSNIASQNLKTMETVWNISEQRIGKLLREYTMALVK